MTLVQDLHSAIRGLLRDRAYTTLAVLSLAPGAAAALAGGDFDGAERVGFDAGSGGRLIRLCHVALSG